MNAMMQHIPPMRLMERQTPLFYPRARSRAWGRSELDQLYALYAYEPDRPLAINIDTKPNRVR